MSRLDRCRRCGAALPDLADLVAIVREADAVLTDLPSCVLSVRTRAAIRLLAALLPCFAGVCIGQAAPSGHVVAPTEVRP